MEESNEKSKVDRYMKLPLISDISVFLSQFFATHLNYLTKKVKNKFLHMLIPTQRYYMASEL